MVHIINFKQVDDPCEYLYFSGGEPHAKVPTIIDDDVHIRVYDMTWADYGHLLCLMNALSWQGKRITLAIPYFPGARQDRNPDGNTPLTVDLLASQICDWVDHIIVVDCHSPIAVAYINGRMGQGMFTHVTTNEIFALWKDQFAHINYVIAPDKGAQDRASRVAEVLGVPVITCEKAREFNTGKITHYEIDVEGNMPQGHYLVVDDICDGGATFEILGESFFNKMSPEDKLAAALNTSISLYVTHPIFTKGVGKLLCYYDHIYTTNSRHFDFEENWDHKVTILDIDPLLKGAVNNELHVQY